MHSRILTDCCEWKCRFYWYKYLYVVGVNYSRHFAMWVHSCLWIWRVQHGRIYQMELRIPSIALRNVYLILNPVMSYQMGSSDFWEIPWQFNLLAMKLVSCFITPWWNCLDLSHFSVPYHVPYHVEIRYCRHCQRRYDIYVRMVQIYTRYLSIV